MLWYVVKLLVLLPLIGGLAWASLHLANRLKSRVAAKQGPRATRLVETTMISPTLRLLVIEFHGRQILVAAGRSGVTRLAEADIASLGGARA